MSLSAVFWMFTSVLSSTSAFDYVIVGGGTAGLTVASRLTDDPDVTVAVIEAGFNAEGLREIFVPGLSGSGITYSTLNWAYGTVPQSNLNGRRLQINAGKALGGSSVINSMIFPRAEKEQYDVWGQLNNDNTWSWSSLLPYFKKSENFTPPNEYQRTTGGATFDPAFHGTEGRLKTGYPNFFYPQAELFRRAVVGLGWRMSPDLSNGDPHAVGVTSNSINSANNTRCSAACAHYTPFASRPNYTVLQNATVVRITWDKATKGKAIGVEYIQNGRRLTVSVGREVILAAGTIGSPKVLELSGVGNSTILRAAGVMPYIELPTVGENFADHVHSWVNSFTNVTLTRDRLNLDTAFRDAEFNTWQQNRTGVLSYAHRTLSLAAPLDIFEGSTLTSMLNDARNNIDANAAEFSNGNPDLAKGIAAQIRIALDLYSQNRNLPLELNYEPGYAGPTAFGSRPQRAYSSISSILYSPLSRGRVHITSSDPSAPPSVDPAYWSHPLDRAIQVQGVKLARRMHSAAPLNSIYLGEYEPGASRMSDSDIEGWLRGAVSSDHHETGSLSMMPRDIGGVVDTKLRVYETRNVRVVDASIIPFPLSAHIMSTVYAIGEKAADIIKEDYTASMDAPPAGRSGSSNAAERREPHGLLMLLLLIYSLTTCLL